MFDLMNDGGVQAGWGTSGVPVSIHLIESDIEGWIETERATRRPEGLIIENLEGLAVGLVVVQISPRPNQSLATLSLALSSEHRGVGLGHDAMDALITALFNEWGIHRVQVDCESDNVPAISLYESLGFTREVVRHRATFTNGEFRDQFVYGLLSHDIRPDVS
jgi:RimJ/RimL family protein N-acetyltransferase